MTNAYKYLIEAGGLEEKSSYRYTGKHGKCQFDSEKVAVRVANFTNIPVDENQIAAHLVHYGPLASEFCLSLLFLSSMKSIGLSKTLHSLDYLQNFVLNLLEYNQL